MKNVLVTGATGFLGRHLANKIQSLGWHVYISNSQIANLTEDKNLHIYNNIKFDYIFHLAVDTKAGDYCLKHQGQQWLNNQIINTNMLKYWKDYQSQAKIIAFGTSCAYSDNESEKTEDKYFSGLPNKDLNVYAMTKRMLLLGLESFNKQFNMKYLYFIPNTLYGENFQKEDNHFIFDLIKKISAAKYENKKAILWGSGNQKREIIYINDVVNFIINNLHIDNQHINIATGVEYSISKYAKIICDYIDYDYNKIIFDKNCYEGQTSKVLKPSKVAGSCNQTNINDGLKKTIDFYISKYYNPKK